MAEKTEKTEKRKNIHTSYVGEFKADSLEVKDNVASATFVSAGGADVQVKGYNSHSQTLQDAVAAGGEQIIRGSLLGGKDNQHMGIYGTGPEQISGVVSNMKNNFDSYEKDGKQPFVNMFVLVERGEHKIGTPVVAFGDDALALQGMAEGDKMTAPARQTHESRTVTDKESGKEATKWTPIYRTEGPGTFEAAPKKEKEDSSPEPEM